MSQQTLITEFMNTKDDVWTVRFTPPDDDNGNGVDSGFFCNGIKKLLKNKKLYRYIVAREKTKSGKVHFHLRFTTEKSESVVRKYFRDSLCSPDLKGQRYCCFHPVQINGVLKDDKLWKSATYVCKDGDIIDSHGYSVSEISDLIAYGNSLKSKGNDPLWLRVISKYRLQEGADDVDIIDSLEEFYKSIDKPLPAWTHIKTAVHNMKYHLQEKYRNDVRMSNLQKMAELHNPRF